MRARFAFYALAGLVTACGTTGDMNTIGMPSVKRIGSSYG